MLNDAGNFINIHVHFKISSILLLAAAWYQWFFGASLILKYMKINNQTNDISAQHSSSQNALLWRHNGAMASQITSLTII